MSWFQYTEEKSICIDYDTLVACPQSAHRDRAVDVVLGFMVLAGRSTSPQEIKDLAFASACILESVLRR